MVGIPRSLMSYIINPLKKLNPYYWLFSSVDYEALHDNFIANQSTANYDRRYYPFTEVNPYNSWYNRLRIYLMGESVAEHSERLAIRSLAYDTMIGFSRVVTNSPIPPSGAVTPSIVTVGLGVNIPTGLGFIDTVHATNVWNKLSSLPTTPVLTPLKPLVGLPDMSNLFDEGSEEALNSLFPLKESELPSTSQVKPSYSWVVSKEGRHK